MGELCPHCNYTWRLWVFSFPAREMQIYIKHGSGWKCNCMFIICYVCDVTWICGYWEAQLHCGLFLLYLLSCTDTVQQTFVIPQFLLHQAVMCWPVFFAFSHPYIHTHPTTLMPVTLCSATLISNMHWSRNIGLTLSGYANWSEHHSVKPGEV